MSARAENAVSWRATMSTLVGVGLVSTAGLVAMTADKSANIAWTAAMLLGGTMIVHLGLFGGSAASKIIDDEGSRDNRYRAIFAGFWAGLVALTLTAIFEQLAMHLGGVIGAVKVASAIMIGTTLLRFGHLEREALN